MKIIIHFLLLVTISFCITSCEPEDDKISKISETIGASNITFHSAVLEGYANITPGDGNIIIGFFYSTDNNPSLTNGKQIIAKELNNNNRYSAKIDSLEKDTTYYYCSFVNQGELWYKGDIKKLRTQNIGINSVTSDIKGITCYCATVESSITIDEQMNYSTLSYGVVYGNERQLNDASVRFVEASNNNYSNSFICTLKGLYGSTTYYYRPYAVIDGYIIYGDINSFTTLSDNVVSTGVIDEQSVTLKSTVSIDSSTYNTIEYGVCYGAVNGPTFENNMTVTTDVIDANNNFTIQLKSVPFDTVYYRAYVIIDGIIHYGETKSFIGNEVTTGNIDVNTYSIRSHIKYSENYKSIVYGVCYGNNDEPTTFNQTIEINEVDTYNDFYITLNNIPFGTVYYRAYVKIDGIIHYGETNCFEGNELFTGIIDTTSYGIKSHIKISEGYSSIDYGVCYGIKQEPTIRDQIIKTNVVDTNRDFVVNLKNIPFGTVYYRAYVTINGEVHYGDICSFEGNKISEVTINTNTHNVIVHMKIGKTFYPDYSLKCIVYYGKDQNPIQSPRYCVSTTNVVDDNYFTLVLESCPFETVYYCASITVNDVGDNYSNIYSFDNIPDVNGYGYVDLGLSVLWATCNVGASNVEDYGNYYAWAEIESKSYYDMSSYKYCGDTYHTITKYCDDESYGNNKFVDNKTIIELGDDVAHIEWGGEWRIPTLEECQELMDFCTRTWTTQNGVNGCIFTSTIDGYTNQSIFLPAGGHVRYSENNDITKYGWYWTNTLYQYRPDYARQMWFYNKNGGLTHGDRVQGLLIRPVCK